jgi:hypothetical protein
MRFTPSDGTAVYFPSDYTSHELSRTLTLGQLIRSALVLNISLCSADNIHFYLFFYMYFRGTSFKLANF